ncbi:MAG: hypothetical protein U0838_06975 [Chloroflexota bacterium]
MDRADRPTGLVGDASALIDLLDANESVITLIVEHVAPIILPTPVLAEISQLDDLRCTALGLTVLEPTLDQLAEAADEHPALSFADQVCLIVARDNGWVCFTSDGPLGTECLARHVPTMRGLRPLIVLVECGALSPAAAIATVERIAQKNRYITAAIVGEFVEILAHL